MNEERDWIGDPRDLWMIVPPLLRSLGTAGGVLAAGWNAYCTNQRDKRIEEAFAKFRRELSTGVLLNEFARSQAGMQLFDNVLNRIEREHCERKRERFANLIVMSWVCDEPSTGIYDEAMLFADATSCFTEAHLVLLMHLYENGPDASVSFRDLVNRISADTPEEQKERGLTLLFDLCSRFGFVRRGWGLNDPNYTGKVLKSNNLGPENLAHNCSHAITTRGQRYIDFVIKGPPKNETAIIS